MQEIILKKVAFGGYDSYEVMNHINALQIKLNKVKDNNEMLEELQDTAKKLEAEIAEKDKEISKLEEKLYGKDKKRRKNNISKLSLKCAENYTESYVKAARTLEKSVRNLTAHRVKDAKQNIETVQGYLEDISSLSEETALSFNALKEEYGNITENCDAILDKTAEMEEEEKRKAAPKKTAKVKIADRSDAKAAKHEADNGEALELIRQTEEKYNNI